MAEESCLVGRRGSVPSGQRAIPEQVLSYLETSSQQPGAPGAAGQAPGTRTARRVAFLGRILSLGPVRSSYSERTCRLSAALPELSLALTPPASLPVSSRVISVRFLGGGRGGVLLRVLFGLGLTPRGGSVQQKRRLGGLPVTPGTLGLRSLREEPVFGAQGTLMEGTEAMKPLLWE